MTTVAEAVITSLQDRAALEARRDALALAAVVDPKAEVELGQVELALAALDRPAAAERERERVAGVERLEARQEELQRRLRPLRAAGKACIKAAALVEQNPQGRARADLLRAWEARFAQEAGKLQVLVLDLRPRIGPRLSYLDGHAPDVLMRRLNLPLDQVVESAVDGVVQRAERALERQHG
jgi:hypothetical protein